jgi:tetratricopeptide (TPR) repeat protein
MLDMSVENPWVVVFHEYAHQLMNGTISEQLDPWFEEGFAEYFSSIEVDGKQARVGKVPEDEYLILRQSGIIKIADLLRVQQNSRTYNESGDHRTTFYAESGMLMHYIYDNQLMAQVGAYFDLKENKHLGSEDAIRQAFGMSAADFDKALRNYISSGHYRYYAIPTPANISSSKYPAVPLSAATGNAVLADIHLHSRDYQEQALKEFAEILKSDANNAAACRGLGYAYLQKQDFKNAQQYFKMASQLDSNDPRVHYYSALLMVRETGFGSDADLPGISRELETSISLDPNFADSYAVLALAQSTAGDSGKAIVTMRKALAISPRNENYTFNLANLYLANRQPDQAIPLLQVLRTANDPEVAARASASLAQAQQFRQMQQSATEPGAGRLRLRTNQSEGDTSTRTENPGNEPLAKMPSASGPAKFLRGTLTNVDCSKSPLALLTVVSAAKTWKMSVADKNHVVLIGTDQFSCDWQKQKVALNYRETSEGEGNVISLELQ